MTLSSISQYIPSWQTALKGGAALRGSLAQAGTMANGIFQKAKENPRTIVLASVAIASMIGLGICLSKGLDSPQEMELRCVKDLMDDEVAYCAEVPAGLLSDKFSNLTFKKILAEKKYYPSPEPGRDGLVSATWNQLHNISLTKSLAEKNYYPSPEAEHLTYSQISGGNEEFVSATWNQNSINYPLALLTAASLTGYLVAMGVMKRAGMQSTSPHNIPSPVVRGSRVPPPPLAPPPPKAPPKAPQLSKKDDTSSYSTGTSLSAEDAQRLIQRHNQITIDIQAKRAQIRALGEKNKEAYSKISLVRGSIQGNKERLEFSRKSIVKQEKSLDAYRGLLAELGKNPTKQLQCSEETQKSGEIAVVLDNGKAIEKLKEDIIKCSKDLDKSRKEIISLSRQIDRSEQQLETLLAAPAAGADVTMGGLERYLQDLDRTLKVVQAQLIALNREMAAHGIKPNGKRQTIMQQADVGPSQAKQHMMKQMEERLITMRILDPKNLRIV